MTRRRALLISSVVNATDLDYKMEVVSSLVIHQATSSTASTTWYVAEGYEGIFTLTNPGQCTLNYSSTNSFDTLLLQHYCIQGASSGSTMYYFPKGCVATATEADGTYTITVTGRIQKYTAKEQPFAYTYTGEYTDSRVDGVGDITFTTSGTLTVTSGTATASAYILAGGGGGADASNWGRRAGGGGGGYQSTAVSLVSGTYEIVVGVGGTPASQSGTNTVTAGTGGTSSAFGMTATGGKGATVSYASQTVGSGGTPGGADGTFVENTSDGIANGGAPNGGGATNGAPQSGGDGLVRLTFGGRDVV